MRSASNTVLVAFILLALPLAAWAQTPLNEAEAIRLGLARQAFVDLEHAGRLAAEAELLATRPYPNPTLSYARDQLGGNPETTEQSLVLSQTFEVSGRRQLRGEAALRRLDQTEAENSARRLEMSAEIRRVFHAVLLRQERIRVSETWARQFTRLEGRVAAQARAGEASGYDRRRLERERRDSEARLAAERAELARDLARLVALTGAHDDLQLTGELTPPPLPPIEAVLAGLPHRPDLTALARRAEAADLDGRAAQRAAIPDITVGIGPRWQDNGSNRDSGLAFAVSVPLPLFDRQQAGRQRSAAEALQARAAHRLALARAEGELRGSHRQAQSLRTAALSYRQQAVAANPELVRIAEAAYQGGESSLLELLDAHRGALDTELSALDLEKKARDARIEFDLISGSTQP